MPALSTVVFARPRMPSGAGRRGQNHFSLFHAPVFSPEIEAKTEAKIEAKIDLPHPNSRRGMREVDGNWVASCR
jgi:hypothetical protein